MKFPLLIVAAALTAALAFPLSANPDIVELGVPIVELMPHVEKLRGELQLTGEQAARIDAWVAEAPDKRKQLEGSTLRLRMELRDAILNNTDRLTRETLKRDLAARQTRLIEIRVLCTRMLRQTLNTAQFDRVVASYRAG